MWSMTERSCSADGEQCLQPRLSSPIRATSSLAHDCEFLELGARPGEIAPAAVNGDSATLAEPEVMHCLRLDHRVAAPAADRVAHDLVRAQVNVKAHGWLPSLPARRIARWERGE